VKVLLDENLDHALRKLLKPHDVATVTHLGWAGLKNGELLRAAEDGGFDAFLTGDQTLVHEQNLAGRRLAVIALSAILLPVIRENVAKIVTAIGSAARGSFQFVECGTSAAGSARAVMTGLWVSAHRAVPAGART
jgi:alkanesulfonate monooxygenase SsuD/methylene tetrahydromethanopterin reductase-like flavin-dependent oxidoreductase (luciferase family)